MLFSGCARKIEPSFAALERLIDSALDLVPRSAALAFADGEGLDATHQLVRMWAARNSRLRALLVPAASELPGRLGRLALCRNTLFGEALSFLPPADGILVTLDLDCRPDVRALAAMLPLLEGPPRDRRWDVLTANSEPYRDHWALRSARLGIDYDCWQDQPRMRQRGECRRYRISIDASAPPFAIDSGFNGLSLLRLGAIHGRNATRCRYPDPASARDTADVGGTARPVCEHVVFNRCLRSHGLRLGLAPALMSNCPCGAVCGERQRYWFRVQIFANDTLSIHDRRKRTPSSPERWRETVGRVCAGRSASGALGPPAGGGAWERSATCGAEPKIT